MNISALKAAAESVNMFPVTRSVAEGAPGAGYRRAMAVEAASIFDADNTRANSMEQFIVSYVTLRSAQHPLYSERSPRARRREDTRRRTRRPLNVPHYR